MISLVMPTIERRETVQEALDSVDAQALQPAQMVLGVGRSPWESRNAAMREVSSPWTAFLDDDDWLLPDHLAVLMAEQEDSGADLAYPDFRVFHDGEMTDHVTGPFDPERLREGNYIPVTYLVRTELVRQVGGFPPREEGKPSDWLFLLKLLDAGASFHHVEKVTWVWRRWAGNVSSWKEIEA